MKRYCLVVSLLLASVTLAPIFPQAKQTARPTAESGQTLIAQARCNPNDPQSC